ncbi:MAG: tRNA-uridine aminocarboxypropyltransferase [Arcobacter sp.]|uniref:tRNA-uridine aminocarboxypropyltransferase n=1 Tax=Arcobacter sp. TaxID=1872629 RepID=UPI003B009943
MENIREYCYECNRAKKSCVCSFIKPFSTKTEFIFLMHPKEYKKTKNNTGKITHQSLLNSKIFVGIDFSQNSEINSIIKDSRKSCFILYPGKDSINLNNSYIESKKQKVIFLIDSTWACSKKILKSSTNLSSLPKISFNYENSSAYEFKKQPSDYCLSTIESTLVILKLLNKQNIENIKKSSLDNFLTPFNKMVEFQMEKSKEKSIRYK